MMISTKGRYALRVIIDIAENSNGGYIAMKEVADRQGISLKYLEKILPPLVKGGLIEGVHGKGGGYKLSLSPDKISVATILELEEGGLAPVACLESDAAVCENRDSCRTLPLWRGLDKAVSDYLDNYYISDLLKS